MTEQSKAQVGKKSLQDLLKSDSSGRDTSQATRIESDSTLIKVEEVLEGDPSKKKIFDELLLSSSTNLSQLIDERLSISIDGVEPFSVKLALLTLIEKGKISNQVKMSILKNRKIRAQLVKSRDLPDTVLKSLSHVTPVKNWSLLKSAVQEYQSYSKAVDSYVGELNKDEDTYDDFRSLKTKSCNEKILGDILSSNPSIKRKKLEEYISEYQEVINASIILGKWFHENDEAMRALLDSYKFQSTSLPTAKPGEKQFKKSKETALSLRKLGDTLKQKLLDELVEKFPDIKKEYCFWAMSELEENPPKPKPSPIVTYLLKKFESSDYFIHHSLISYMLDFMDSLEIVYLRQSSKIWEEFIDIHLRKILSRLPFNNEPSHSNINYWYKAMRFFFRDGAYLIPQDRLTYKPVLLALKANKSLFPVTADGMHYQLTVSLDRLLPEHIIYCDHHHPMPHTCSAKKEVKGFRNATSQEISIGKFTKEYADRIVFNYDELVWKDVKQNIDQHLVVLLFWQFLNCMSRLIAKQNGFTSLRRIELMCNNQESLTHRIWLQATFKWGMTKNSDSMKTLYLTIADHYRWTA